MTRTKSRRHDDDDVEVDEESVGVEPQAVRNPPTNVNVATGNAANTAGAVNQKPVGGSDLPAPAAANNKPAGGAPTWESGEGVTATLASISPTGAVHNAGDFSLTATGTNLQPTSVIVFGGVAQDTTYISATSIRCTVANTTGVSAGAVPVLVANGVTNTAPQTFTYT